jgi:hypothetical protein
MTDKLTDLERELLKALKTIGSCDCKEECWPKPCPHFIAAKVIPKAEAKANG